MIPLEDLVMNSDIEGYDRYVLYGWVHDLEDDDGIVFKSKDTVAAFLGLSLSTIQRHTKALLAAGWMSDTGQEKKWSAEKVTPIYQVIWKNWNGRSN